MYIEIALAWLQAQKPWMVSIPGTTHPAHLAENIGATKVTFTQSEEMRAAIEKISTVGFRTPDTVQKDQ